jgi:hypothetical protein
MFFCSPEKGLLEPGKLASLSWLSEMRHGATYALRMLYLSVYSQAWIIEIREGVTRLVDSLLMEIACKSRYPESSASFTFCALHTREVIPFL